MRKVCFLVLRILGAVSATEYVFLQTRSESGTADLCAERITAGKSNYNGTSLPSNLVQNAIVIDDLAKFCDIASKDNFISRWAPTMVFYRSCTMEKSKSGDGRKCQWCCPGQNIFGDLEKDGVETVVFYNQIVDRVNQPPCLRTSGQMKGYANISFIEANPKPPRLGFPYQSKIRGKFFQSEFDHYGQNSVEITPWMKRFLEDEKEDRNLRKSIAALVLTIVATVTAFLGSRNAARLGYDFYLKCFSARKKEIAVKILKRAMEKKNIREQLGLQPTKVEEILEQDANEIKEDKGGEDNSNNNNVNDKSKITIRRKSASKSSERQCEWRYVVLAIIITVFLSILLVIMWLARDYIIDILDVVFILTSVFMMVAINPVLRKIPCGSKKLVCLKPNCCRRRNEDEDEKDSSDSVYEKYYENQNLGTLAKKKCCSVEIRQIFGIIFCLGIGVVWYLFRMDYEHIWGLHMFLSCCVVCGISAFLADSLLPKYQYVVFVSIGILLYDIFMVHVTPLFTENKRSIMIDVALHPASEGNLPRMLAFVIYFPDYFPSTYASCMGVSFTSLLGLGDLVFAAIIMEYTFTFELVTTDGRKAICSSYEMVCVTCYFASLVACFIVVFWTESPQPALEFIIPFLLIGVFINAAYRREAKRLWNLDYTDYPNNQDLVNTVRTELIALKKQLDVQTSNFNTGANA